jgi:type IV secretory pathway VirB9-like protein
VNQDATTANHATVVNQAVTTFKFAISAKRTATTAKHAIIYSEAKNMTTQQNNQPISQTANHPQLPQPCNQQRFNQQPMTDERLKQMIMDTLIELKLVSQPQKKKVLADV